LGPDIEDLSGKAENYDVDIDRQQSFFESARRFLPGLAYDDLAPDYSGIRPQRAGMTGFRDFYIAEETARGAPGWINLIGIESPGLTAALAIARHVTALGH
jgi:L-2-hydroxyglutarate oxidase LhgO